MQLSSTTQVLPCTSLRLFLLNSLILVSRVSIFFRLPLVHFEQVIFYSESPTVGCHQCEKDVDNDQIQLV